MVGLEKFREYFKDYPDQYILIGGAACAISFREADLEFRATRDIDMVLIVEALTREFGERLWQFIREGGYVNRAKSNGQPQFYRFAKPTEPNFPKMIELFSRTQWTLDVDSVATPLHIDDSVSSLSAILLNAAYYSLLMKGREIIDDISVLTPTYLIPFKAKAWLDLREKSDQGQHVDARDINKHRKDIAELTEEFPLQKIDMPEEVREDMRRFLESVNYTDRDP